MFYALAEASHSRANGYEFEHILQDIQTLNERATRAELDITAISIHAYAYVLKDYALLRSGASMGDGYGPMIVGKAQVHARGIGREENRRSRPHDQRLSPATAFLGLPKEKLNYIVVPFDQIFDALARGEADAGLIIHEGQLTYATEGLVVSADFGQWWATETGGLPLPLGGNAVKKSLGREMIVELSEILYQSIKYGLDHRAAGVEHALPLGRGLDRALADKFIGMYVNELTLDYGDRGRKGVREFLDRAHHAGLIPATGRSGIRLSWRRKRSITGVADFHLQFGGLRRKVSWSFYANQQSP